MSHITRRLLDSRFFRRRKSKAITLVSGTITARAQIEDSPKPLTGYGYLCNSETCQFLAALDFKADSNAAEVLRQTLVLRFPGVEGLCELPIGQVKTIAARTHCPFCRFVSTLTQNLSHNELPPNTMLSAHWYKPTFGFNIFYFGVEGVKHMARTFEEQITFLESEIVSSPEAGRIVDPKGIDYLRVGSWLKQCEELHEICPREGTRHHQDLLPLLRVVDVQDMRLTEIPWSEQYIALSYVWGGARPPQLLQADLQLWKTAGSVQRQWGRFPKSIRDCIEAVRRLRLRYLWFDSLCLLQDDIDELRQSINNMDKVFERAYLTIVAANGFSADEGLPGVTEPRNSDQVVQHLKPGLGIVKNVSLDGQLRRSTWATRGWTYVQLWRLLRPPIRLAMLANFAFHRLQEQHLSRRTLCFVNGQVYFRCRERTWREDSASDFVPTSRTSVERTGGGMLEIIDDKYQPILPYHFLIFALGEFSRRSLTVENDALNAISGILRRVSDATKTEMVEGLPIMLLPIFLIFRRDYHAQTSRGYGNVHRRTQFPSWSWAGWHAPLLWEHQGQVSIARNADDLVEWLQRGNWITWSVSKAGSAPKGIHNPATIKQDFTAAIATRSTELNIVSESSPSVPVQNLFWAVTSPLPSLPCAMSSKQVTEKKPLPTDIPYSVLVFQTPSIWLRLGPVFGYFSSSRCELFDNTDTSCGDIYPDLPFEMRRQPINDEDAAMSIPDEFFCPPPIREFIILSERNQNPKLPMYRPDHHGGHDITNVVKQDGYWIMMVEYLEEKGVYERRGIGNMLKTSLDKSFAPGPIWKEMSLA